MTTTPRVGEIVDYTLTELDAALIQQRRDQAKAVNDSGHIDNLVGNTAAAGEVYPMIIVRVWGNTPESSVNGQVLLDGNDTLWVTSVSQGEGPRKFQRTSVELTGTLVSVDSNTCLSCGTSWAGPGAGDLPCPEGCATLTG